MIKSQGRRTPRTSLRKTKIQVLPTDFPINPATTSGSDLADILNRLFGSMMSQYAGYDRPPQIDRGGIWTQYLDDGTCILYQFDGASDNEIGRISIENGRFETQNQLNIESGVADLDSRVGYIENTISTSIGIPRGIVAMWSGTADNIPEAWALCNGENETPDLTDRFIIAGGRSYEAHSYGGSKTITLDNLPPHDHGGATGGTTSEAGYHAHGLPDPSHAHGLTLPFGPVNQSYSGGGQGVFGGGDWGTGTAGAGTGMGIDPDGSHTHELTVNVISQGAGADYLPPYYVLCYIMKL